MKYYRIIGIVCVWIFFIGQICAQSVSDNECLRLVESNDSDVMACILSSPVSCFWLANSTIRIPFFATSPIDRKSVV